MRQVWLFFMSLNNPENKQDKTILLSSTVFPDFWTVFVEKINPAPH